MNFEQNVSRNGSRCDASDLLGCVSRSQRLRASGSTTYPKYVTNILSATRTPLGSRRLSSRIDYVSAGEQAARARCADRKLSTKFDSRGGLTQKLASEILDERHTPADGKETAIVIELFPLTGSVIRTND